MSPPSQQVGGHTSPVSPTKLRPWSHVAKQLKICCHVSVTQYSQSVEQSARKFRYLPLQPKERTWVNCKLITNRIQNSESRLCECHISKFTVIARIKSKHFGVRPLSEIFAKKHRNAHGFALEFLRSGVKRKFWPLRNFWPVVVFQLFCFSE